MHRHALRHAVLVAQVRAQHHAQRGQDCVGHGGPAGGAVAPKVQLLLVHVVQQVAAELRGGDVRKGGRERGGSGSGGRAALLLLLLGRSGISSSSWI